jgi:hypothetical protein
VLAGIAVFPFSGITVFCRLLPSSPQPVSLATKSARTPSRHSSLPRRQQRALRVFRAGLAMDCHARRLPRRADQLRPAGHDSRLTTMPAIVVAAVLHRIAAARLPPNTPAAAPSQQCRQGAPAHHLALCAHQRTVARGSVLAAEPQADARPWRGSRHVCTTTARTAKATSSVLGITMKSRTNGSMDPQTVPSKKP